MPSTEKLQWTAVTSTNWQASEHDSPLQQCTAFFFFFLMKCPHYFVFRCHRYLTNCTLQRRRPTYSENEVLCKDIVGSHSSSTASTGGYFWNAIRDTKKPFTLTCSASEKCICLHNGCCCRIKTARQYWHQLLTRPLLSKLFTFWLHPFHSLIWKWKKKKKTPAAGCFYRLASRREHHPG